MQKIEDLKKIAEGAQAEIFLWTDDKVLRLYRSANDKDLIKWEIASMKALLEAGIRVPATYETVEIDGRPGFVMDLINGRDFLSTMSKNPFSVYKTAREFALIQARVHETPAPEGLIRLKQRIKMFVEPSKYLPQHLTDFILSLLDELPDGDRLCHGDFQPGNVLVENGVPVLIDWVAASSGDPVSEVANTMFLLKKTSLPPSIPPLVRGFLTVFRNVFAAAYLRAYRRYRPFDNVIFSKWQVVRMAERLSFAVPGEQELLTGYIEKYYANYKKGRYISI